MNTTAALQGLLERHQAGLESVRNPLLEHSMERLRLLARRSLRGMSDVRRVEETDDVLQRAVLRLYKALETVKPVNVAAFFSLAGQQIRWTLLDLVKDAKQAKRITSLNPHDSGPVRQDRGLMTLEGEPTDLLEWADFHAAIEKLPEEERQVVDLLVYQGLDQPEAAQLLGQSLRTLKRRWQSARLRLRQMVGSDTQ